MNSEISKILSLVLFVLAVVYVWKRVPGVIASI